MSQAPNPYAPPHQAPGQFPSPPPGAEQFAPCPNCGNVYAKKVGFTLWGGALGPKLCCHVTCTRCGRNYNGKTGRPNTTFITIYIVISLILGLIVGILLAAFGVFG